MHLEELDDPQKFVADGVKVISQLEYVSRLNELKDEINRAWLSDDRVTSLKLSIKVARLLMDTSVAQFYPTLFVLPTDIMDMLGDMVWERIRWRAEFAEDGTLICSLPEKFEVMCVLMLKKPAITGSAKLVPSPSFFHESIWSWPYCLVHVSFLSDLLITFSAWLG